MKALLNKLTNVTTETLKEMAIKLNNDFSDGADLVFDAVLNALESRVDEVEFLELMETLD